MSGHNVFAGAFVDRSGHRRRDSDWLAAIAASPDAVFAPVWKDRCLAIGEPPLVALLARDRVAGLTAPEESVFLGMFRGRPAFAFEIASEAAPFPDDGEFHDLRYLGSVLPPEEANLVAHAIALVNWHRTQRHCGRCGGETRPTAAGNTRTCTAAGCGREVFPRVDPAIIVLVADGDRCLLGRQPSWPEGRYSTIAGFVEPGESLEDAVIRETLEEAGVAVDAVEYHSSQPWPFPSSIMLGFYGRARSLDLDVDTDELETARWFHRDEILASPEDETFRLPRRDSISFRLISDWLNAGA